ncbi:MAG TPA: hypothetical protein VMF90_11775 [Rhizobiaceae bacterium]|nr:hypothetical protein [Rhizobiaceae bacterium]
MQAGNADEGLVTFQRLLDRAIWNPSLWRQVCDALADLLGGVGAILVPEDIGQQGPWLVASRSLDPLIKIGFRDGWHLKNFRRRAIPIIKRRGHATDFDIADAATLRSEPFYTDLLAPLKLGTFLGLGFEAGAQTWIASVQFAAGRPPNQTAIERAARIRPILAAAATAAAAIGARRFEDWKTLLARPNGAALAIDRHGRMLGRADASDTFLKIGFLLKGRHLHTRDFLMDSAFQDLLSAASTSDGSTELPAPVLWRGADGRLLVADALPIYPESVAFHDPLAAFILVRHVREAASPLGDRLKQSVSLTEAETRLALALFEGISLKDYADRAGNTIGTVRNQLKSIFRKTKTGRQAELVTWMRKLIATQTP